MGEEGFEGFAFGNFNGYIRWSLVAIHLQAVLSQYQMARTKTNLHSPNQMKAECAVECIFEWFHSELQAITSPSVAQVLTIVAKNIDEFICWPEKPLLLWQSCDRVAPPNKKQKYFTYPQPIRELAKQSRVRLDSRPNGPAISAFLLAGGKRPSRFGSSNAWSIHHLYSGKFPYLGTDETLHACKHGLHFTQSAGLIATHPIADALSDEIPFFAWLLRAESFRRFGYDPDGVFSSDRDPYGFVKGKACEVICREL
ncbi:MAG: hypothetical protein SGJ20_21200 [Planctomycetota bacterium]|nr:hypothetical protein [Planctomycetota bacterium]